MVPPWAPQNINAPDICSSASMEFNLELLKSLWYFKNVWTNCAFKLPGCVGYDQAPTEENEVVAIVQDCLSDETKLFCLLAPCNARMNYLLAHQQLTPEGFRVAHGYAGRAIYEEFVVGCSSSTNYETVIGAACCFLLLMRCFVRTMRVLKAT